MDSKLTLSFDADVIEKAKQYADANNISVSRLVEFLLKKVTTKGYHSLEDYPISEWVNMVAEEQAEYITKKRSSKDMKNEYFESRKK